METEYKEVNRVKDFFRYIKIITLTSKKEPGITIPLRGRLVECTRESNKCISNEIV